MVCHYYNGKYFKYVLYFKWLHPFSIFFSKPFWTTPRLDFHRRDERKLYVSMLPQVRIQTNP